MRSYKKELEEIANDLLNQNADAKGNENKPNYSNRDFMNATIIFQTALMDKMYDNQEYDMVFGGKVKITKQGDKTFVNGSEILASITTANGIIHVIGDVLLPK